MYDCVGTGHPNGSVFCPLVSASNDIPSNKLSLYPADVIDVLATVDEPEPEGASVSEFACSGRLACP